MTSFEEILEMKEKKDINNLILSLKIENTDIRAFIIQTIGDIGDEKSSEAIIPFLDDKSKKVRKEAAMALGLLNGTNSILALTKALKDNDEDVRQIAVFALIKIGNEDALKPLMEALYDKSENVREIAVLGVEAFKNKEDIDLINQLDNYGEKLQLNIKPRSFLRTPHEIVELISKIAHCSHPEYILDPACGTGSLISGLKSKLKNKSKIYCNGMNKEFFEKSENISDIKIIYDDFFKFKEKTKIKFDIIVSDMFIYTINPENITKKNIRFKIALLLGSLELLNVDGRLIFLIPESFLYSDKYLEARNFIKKKFSLEGVISIPTNISYFYSGVKTSLIIIKKSNIEESFFAEYKNFSAMDDIVDNFLNHKTNKNVSQGFWLSASVLEENNIPWNFAYLKSFKKEKKEKTQLYEIKPLSELTRVKDQSGNKYALIFPKDSSLNEHRFIYRKELKKDSSDTNFFYFEISDHKVSPQYLKFYLNSSKVQNRLNIIISKLDKIEVEELKAIPIEIPNKRIQDNIIQAEMKSKVLIEKIESLCNNFSNEISTYSEIIEFFDYLTEKELIWPIVNSLYISKSTTNLDEKIKKYFKLFEFIAAFNSIVLISALPEVLFNKEKDFLFDKENSDYSKTSFGDWVGLFNRLKGVYMSLEKNKSFYETIPLTKEFYEKLTDKKFSSILNPIVKMRNDYVHGEDLHEFGKNQLLIKLDNYLRSFLDLLTVYNSVELIYTISMKKYNGLYYITVKKLKGASYPFSEITIETEEDMDTEVLYLYSPLTEQRLKLKTELIRLKECKTCGKLSLYVYNKLKSNLTHYISYQDEIHPYDDKKNPMNDLLYL